MYISNCIYNITYIYTYIHPLTTATAPLVLVQTWSVIFLCVTSGFMMSFIELGVLPLK